MVSVFLLLTLATAIMARTQCVKGPAVKGHRELTEPRVQRFYEGCNRKAGEHLSTYVPRQSGKAPAVAVVLHPNIAVTTEKRLLTENSNIRVGAEWRPVEDVIPAKNMYFTALLWEKNVTNTSTICVAEDSDQLNDCHAEFWRNEDGPVTWSNFSMIRGEACQGGTTVCVQECLPNNAAVFCKAPGNLEVFVGFAINCNKGKTRLADMVDARKWLYSMKKLFSEE